MNEKALFSAEGLTRDIIRKDGIIIEDTGWRKNRIVDNLAVIIASLLKMQSGFSGACYWAIGSGDETWDIPALPEISQLAITHAAISSGSVVITLNGIGFPVAVSAGDSDTVVSTKIRNATYSGWTTSGTGTTIIFTSVVSDLKTDALFSGGTTGVTGTMTTTQQGNPGSTRPEPLKTDVKCLNEIFRKQILPANIKFLDNAGIETSAYTNTIELTVQIAKTEAIGKWREFCIFAGNATSAKDSGYNINRKTHGIIDKTDEMDVERKIKFTFNNA